MTEGVKNFLCRLGLDQYNDMFTVKGFDLESDICYLNDEDLNSMYISNRDDRQRILREAMNFKPSREHILYEWLREKGLDHYYISFIQSELVDLTEIARLNLPDEDLYDELELTLPGHRRRLERAVRQLAKKFRSSLPSIAHAPDNPEASSSSQQTIHPVGAEYETPVAYGRWGKPRCLVDAKYDFLIIDATVISTHDPRDRVDIEFMVDSGSDVVTLRQEVLDTMDLELIGPIHSKGVHASRTKNLYRAHLRLGKQVIEIEVMGESYDSIGSRVIRHFRHYISGSQHLWLKGDFIDPEMFPKSSPITSSQESLTTTSSSSQEKPVERSVPSPSETVPSISRQQSSHSQQPEEQGDESSTTGTLEQIEQTSEDIYATVQNDSVKGGRVDVIELSQPDIITSNKSSADIDFNFVKATVPKEVDDQTDETDKVSCDNDDVIDIRPIINANRKRHAVDNSGSDPQCGDADVTKIRRKNRSTIQDNLKSLRTIKLNNNDVIDTHVTKMENESVEFETVMGQRSVYYRSQVKKETKSET